MRTLSTTRYPLATERKKKPDFSRAKGVLNMALRRYNLAADFERYNFVLHWPEIVGEEIAKRSKPECFRGNTLVIRVTDSVWAQELCFYKDVILKRLQRYLKTEQTVDDIRFSVGS